jgi:hypothetical protein
MPRHPKAADLAVLLAADLATRASSSSSSGEPRRCYKARRSRPTTSTSSTGGRQRTWHVSSRFCCTSMQRCATTSPTVDPLCELDAGQGYEELLAYTRPMIDEGRLLRVLDLPTLIAVKTKAGRPKDRVVLPILIATLQERDKANE